MAIEPKNKSEMKRLKVMKEFELPRKIDLQELKKAIDYLIGIEFFHLARAGIKQKQYDFDQSHFEMFFDWLVERTKQQ